MRWSVQGLGPSQMGKRRTPPFSQISISFLAALWVDGKNHQNSWLSSLGSAEMGSRPAYDSPTSKLTSGILVPSTANLDVFALRKSGCEAARSSRLCK